MFLPPLLLAVSVLLFVMLSLVPGDLAQALAGPTAPPEAVEELREELRLDEPVHIRYATWLGNLLEGNLGKAHSVDRPVAAEVAERFAATLVLAGSAFLLTTVAGLGIGVLLATRRHSLEERAATFLVFAGISTPSFWLGLILVMVFAVWCQWLPASGMMPLEGGNLLDLLAHLALPTLTLAVVASSVVARLMRGQMLECLRLGYVQTARAKGLPESLVVWRHTFLNAVIAIIPVLGLQAGYVLGGTVYVETIFQWPGIGRMLVQAILSRDLMLVLGGVLVVATAFILINLIADLLQAWLDPRIRVS